VVEVALVVVAGVAADAGEAGVMVVVGGEVDVESGGFNEVEVACGGPVAVVDVPVAVTHAN
jgi:hypothetical protein